MKKQPSIKQMSAELREKGRQAFLEPSVEKGVMYHGTRSNIKSFRPDPKKVAQLHSNAIFVTPAEDIANEFATKHQGDKTFSDFEAPPSKHPKGANILPVHVQAKNPFDAGKPEHYKALVEHLKKNPPPLIGKFTESANLDRFKEDLLKQALSFAHDAHTSAQIPQDNYNSIERREIQDAIKQMGHDSFYVHEMGTKNLGVFDPRKIKSAIGNRGTYDINEPDINKAKGGVVSLLRKHGRPVDSDLDAMKKMSNGHRVFIAHEQDEKPREITSVSEMHGYTPDQIYTIDPKHFMQHKAIGGSMQPQSEPTLAQMRLEVARHSNPAVMDNIGVNEAVDIYPKMFVNPNPNSSGLPDVGGVKTDKGALPVGGVDVNPMQSGTQFMPQQPQQQPPQGQQSPLPSMAPAGSGMPQDQSNILNLTPQGQAMSAIKPPMTPNMAKGGAVGHFAKGGSQKEKAEESKRILVEATGPNGIKGIVIPRHMLEGKTYGGTGPKAGQKVEGLLDLNKARAKVYGSENRPPLNIGQMGRIHKQVLSDHFAKPIDEQTAAEKEALERLREAKHIGSKANTLDESEKLDTVRHETDDQGRTHVGYAAKGIAGHALYLSGDGKNEKLHVLNTCPGQVDGCGGGIDQNGIVDTKRGSCFAPNAESQYVNAAVRRAAHAQAKHDPAMTRDWVLAHTGSLREAADEADKNNQRLLFRPNVVDESDTSSRHVLRGLNEQRKKEDKPPIIANSYGKTNELHDPENHYHVTHSNVGPKTKHGKEITDSIKRDKARVRNTILARDNQGDFVNEQGKKTPPKNSYMVTNVKRGSPFDKAMQSTITHAKYWSLPRPLNELTEMEKDEGSEGHYDGKGNLTTPDKAHYGHMVVGDNRYDYQKQHILHPRLVQVGTNNDGTPHMIPTDSRFLDNKELDKKIPRSKQFKTKNGKRAGLILMTTPTESTPNHEHHSSFTHDVNPTHLEYAKKNNGEYEIDPPLAQEFARGKEYVAPEPMKMVKKTWATGGAVHSSLKQLDYNDDFNAFPETNFASQHHLAKRRATKE